MKQQIMNKRFLKQHQQILERPQAKTFIKRCTLNDSHEIEISPYSDLFNILEYLVVFALLFYS